MGSGGWITFFVFSVLVLIGVIVGVSARKKGKQLQEEGKIIKRTDSFWESEEYLTTVSSYAEIKSGIKRADLTECRVTTEYDCNGKAMILFRCSQGWNCLKPHF